MFFISMVIFFWNQLSPQEKTVCFSIFKNNMGYAFIFAVLLVAGMAFALDGILHNYIMPLHKLAEETSLIHTVNPSHRIKIEANRDITNLARIINEGADRHEALQKEVQQKIQQAKADVEEEKNILAAFMSELTEGVLICNTEGQILFYNRQARKLLECGMRNAEYGTDAKETVLPDPAFIGLGRSIFGIIDKSLVVHGLDEMSAKIKRQDVNLTSYFVVVDRTGNLLRVEAVPVLNHDRKQTGFILIIRDITQQLESETRVDFLLESLSRGIRASLAGIRSAVEAVLEYPDMNGAQLNVFTKIIHEESIALGSVLDKTALDYSNHIKTQWPLVQMPARGLLESVRKIAKDKLGISADVEKSDKENWVRVDSYSIVWAMLFVLSRLKNETGAKKYTCRIEKKERFVNIDLLWKGSPIKIEILKKWEDQALYIEKEGTPLTLKEVIGHHEAEIWCHSCQESKKKSYFRFCLPAVETFVPDTARAMAILPKSRPEFYDFDLFNQPGQTSELDNRLLSELTYTVFDTETTGLDPSEDEIISVGAVRIVNGRLLHEENIDQLIDPKRGLPIESIKIHGIQPEMLKGQPVIGKILPSFKRFAEDTILVGHNAAFDMRMLQMKEGSTGVKFINPVLDTLLLSAVIHPAQDNHNLEEISKRLGIRIVGRHTALGDAIATGEIFLKMIPLLEKEGIKTLKEARLASQKTYYARIKY
ncbi:MAG: PAS domain-containing protein [Desulfobacterales bacterium]|nr:PAS domain-containing protein [Desulfobacterales bacterium]